MNSQTYELSMDQLDAVNGGGITIVAEKGYVGVEIKVGGYGVAIWATQGSVCTSVTTPTSNPGGTCTPA
jgi:hypothetical protein